MAAYVEENVLIPKREYQTLLQEIEKKNETETSVVGGDSDSKGVSEMDTSETKDSDIVMRSVNVKTGMIDDSNKSIDKVSSETNVKGVEEEEEEYLIDKTKPKKNVTENEGKNSVTKPVKFNIRDPVQHGDSGDDEWPLRTEPIDKKPSSSERQSQDTLKAESADNLSVKNESVATAGGAAIDKAEQSVSKEKHTAKQIVLAKVPVNLKEPVTILVDYIQDNASGIIEWDENLRFVYLKQTLPKTNIVKLLSYSLGKGEKPPKAASVFQRALASVGVTDALKMVTSIMNTEGSSASQTPPSPPTQGSKQNNKKNSTDLSESNDDVDAAAAASSSTSSQPGNDKDKNIQRRTSKRNLKKFNNLAGKWLKW